MHIYIYIYLHIYVYTYIYIYVYICMNIYIYDGDLWSKSDIFATFFRCTKVSLLRCKLASPKPFALTK